MLQGYCLTLQSQSSSVDEVFQAGVRLMIGLHGGSEGDTLASLRYARYCSMSLGHRFRPISLPSSNSDACLHSMRAHYQAVFKATFGSTCIKPVDWNGNLKEIH